MIKGKIYLWSGWGCVSIPRFIPWARLAQLVEEVESQRARAISLNDEHTEVKGVLRQEAHTASHLLLTNPPPRVSTNVIMSGSEFRFKMRILFMVRGTWALGTSSMSQFHYLMVGHSSWSKTPEVWVFVQDSLSRGEEWILTKGLFNDFWNEFLIILRS